MHSLIFIAGTLVVLIILIIIVIRFKYNSIVPNKQSASAYVADMQPAKVLGIVPASKTNTGEILAAPHYWWKDLDSLDQLHLALILTEKALPVWEKYTTSHELTYRDLPTMPLNKIDNNLLQSTIDEIAGHSTQGLPAINNKIIYQCYFNFVGPVLAIQDGTWLPSYVVKKEFLAVYNMVKAIMEQNNPLNLKAFLTTSISHALDVMDIAKLYSEEEIIQFVEPFKKKVLVPMP